MFCFILETLGFSNLLILCRFEISRNKILILTIKERKKNPHTTMYASLGTLVITNCA